MAAAGSKDKQGGASRSALFSLGGGTVAKFFDFDAFWSESMPEEAEPKQIKVFGEVIDLPTTLPARIMFKAMRYQEDNSRGLGEQMEAYIDDLKLFVGADRVEQWLDRGIEAVQIVQIFTHIIGMYLPAAEGGDGEEGNAKAPATGETSKKQGQSSKTGH